MKKEVEKKVLMFWKTKDISVKSLFKFIIVHQLSIGHIVSKCHSLVLPFFEKNSSMLWHVILIHM